MVLQQVAVEGRGVVAVGHHLEIIEIIITLLLRSPPRPYFVLDEIIWHRGYFARFLQQGRVVQLIIQNEILRCQILTHAGGLIRPRHQKVPSIGVLYVPRQIEPQKILATLLKQLLGGALGRHERC